MSRNIKDAVKVAAGVPWSYVVKKGQTLRIIDLEGCQAVDTLFYNANDHEERYSANDTIREQGNIFITTGTKLISTDDNVMMEITADTCGNHDTLGGHCSAESNTVRYGDNYLFEIGEREMDPRDLTNNINFFMNVPVEENGYLIIVDGISKPGNYVDMKAEMDTLVLVSNCPQLNNPCNAFNPSPVQMVIWDD